ncbi:MAG: HD domain-containing protein [Acidobacteria bacterium]|nr:HD domain-containing protein [Acidobacteriota bacterium]
MRQAQEDTVSGFVKAIEALDPYTKGHTDRVVQFCRMTGEQLGLEADQLEVLRWSALIHDVGKLAAPAELINREGPLTEEEQARLGRRMAVVEELLSRVDFLAAAVEVSAASRQSQGTQLIGRVLGAADAFDAITTTRSYRSAVTQTAAFDQLRRDSGLYGSEVVEALIAAIVASDVVYGAPDAGAASEVELLVQDRIRRG